MNYNSIIGDPVPVIFTVEQDENGYPSVGREQIWCLPAGGEKFVVDNIPFYARDVSMGDEICAEVRDGERWFTRVSTPSRNTTVRAFVRNEGIAPTIIPKLRSFGGLTEKMESSPLIAISFPPSADLAGALDYLDHETDAGNVAFEESAVRYR